MMDYHSIHGHDISSFDAPDRLPTVSASQALEELKDTSTTHISTGLDSLDKFLLGSDSSEPRPSTSHGGIKRGQVTEIWGPPGSGKTAIGLQLASHALCDGDGVVWLDCFQILSHHRVATTLNAVRNSRDADGDSRASDGDISKFVHYECATLPHLLALTSRPTPKAIPPDVSLVVISSVSALINAALPRAQDSLADMRANKGFSLSAKRLQALRSIMDSLRKLAATRNCAVVVLSQCASKMQSEGSAALVAAVNATVWEQGVSTRIALFKDWIRRDEKPVSAFLAGVQKIDGKSSQDAVGHVSAFRVEATGVSQAEYDAAPLSITVSDVSQQKRKLGQTGFEVPDSEDDEDYGWAEEDEAAMPPPPPQWQGSEDILLGQEVGRSEEDADGEGRSDGESAGSGAEERSS